MRTRALFLAVACVFSIPVAARCGSPGDAAGPADKAAPLAGLPGQPRDHVEKVKSLKDNGWLDLGTPAPDPKWGTARGRSWGAHMAYAPDLRAAFLFGEGVHGWWDKDTGRYMDDLWAYDCNAHRWVCVYPGADVNALDLKLNDHGVEVTKAGDPQPVAQMVHGYQGTTYDPDRRRFLFMPCSGGYWDKAMGERRMAWLKEKKNEAARDHGPWEYDTRTDRWDRRPTAAPAPKGGFGDVLEYVPTVKRVFLRTGGGGDVWWYDLRKNTWTKAEPKGPPPPFGIDPTACYDTKRDRLYVGGGNYPVAKGPNALWAYDVKAETWIDLQPKGICCGGSNSYNTNIAVMAYDRANDAVVLTLHKADGGGTPGGPELAATPIPLAARISVLPCRGGEGLLRRLFEPLGYAVAATHHPLDERFPEWGEGPYFTVELSHVVPLHDLLTHLYVLVTVLDDDKHYWIGDDEVQKLLRHGGPWLASHPEREQIVRRYLKHRRHLADQALARLIEADPDEAEEVEEQHAGEEERVEQKLSLNEHRLNTVLSGLRAAGAKRVLDLGCSTGNLLRRLLEDRRFEHVVGLDVSHRALEVAAERLHLDRMPERQRQRIQLLHGSLIYRDERIKGFDAAAVVEVIEHLDEPRLAAFERVLFEFARPGTVVVTTPNVEYNVRFETLPAGRFRHKDHRFEWTRGQFRDWAAGVAGRFGYGVRFLPVGPEDAEVGPATQMAAFRTPGRTDVHQRSGML